MQSDSEQQEVEILEEGDDKNDAVDNENSKCISCHISVKDIEMIEEKRVELGFENRSEYLRSVIKSSIYSDSNDNDNIISGYLSEINDCKKEIKTLKSSNTRHKNSCEKLKKESKKLIKDSLKLEEENNELRNEVHTIQLLLTSKNDTIEQSKKEININDEKDDDIVGIELEAEHSVYINKLVYIENNYKSDFSNRKGDHDDRKSGKNKNG